ncbi:MAG: creatininase family protein [Gemmatimonadota bacterium]|nr:creatininase family protein [Gemmatimonadota bacterium]MDE3005885.1 creatininase family protein [Gemmatimonadota bacterium]MDE3014389.1 creatininase family protein [Gemmatimonadota bacterium]
MAVHRFADLTWEEVRDLDRTSAVAVLPVGAVEAHGPHLPLGTDVVIAEGMARVCAEGLSEAGRTGLILPPLWYTAAGFAGNFPGTIGVDGAIVSGLIIQIATSLREQEIRTLAIANAHLDPAHLTSLRHASDGAPEGARIVFLDLTRRRVAEQLTPEFQTGACHAGRFEGSIVMAERPDLYRAEIAADLEPNPSSLSTAIGEGHETFEQAGGPRAYFGWPSEATAEEGRTTVRTLGHLLAEAILDGEVQ